MADYLTGLAARALGVAKVVRPRPAAWFGSALPFEEQEPASVAASPVPVRPRATPKTGGIEPVERPAPTPGRVTRVRTPPPSTVEPELEPAALRDDMSLLPTDAAPPRRPGRRPPSTGTAPVPSVERARAIVRPAARRAVEQPVPLETVKREPPPVRVTIGRIEVRAVAAPPAPPRPAPERPAPLSLDEYLELRRSGRR
jgi:hypothetical protein